MSQAIKVYIKILFLSFFILHPCWNIFNNKNNANIHAQIVKSYNTGKMKTAYELIEKHFPYDKKKAGQYFIQIKILFFLKEFDKAQALIEELQDRKLCFDKLLKEELKTIKEDLEKEKNIYKQDIQNHTDAEHTHEFLKYLYSNDCCSAYMNIFYNKYNVRGLKATKNIKTGDTIMSLDKNFLLTDKKARDYIIERLSQDKQQGQMFMSQLEYPKTTSIAIFILEHRHDVEYEQYFNIIFSNDYSSFPYFFDKKTHDILLGTTALEKIEEKETIISHDWNEMQKIDAFKQYSYEDFKKAFCGVISRTYGATVNQKESITCLAPFMDLENHSNKTNTRWFFDSEDQHFKLQATMDINKDEELLTSYGSTKSNTELLYTYGFAIEENKNNANIFLKYKNHFYKCTDNLSRSTDNSGESELGNLICMIYNDSDEKEGWGRVKTTFNTILNLCYKLFKQRQYNMNIIQEALNKDKDTMSFNKKNCYYIVIEEQEVTKKIIEKIEKIINILKKEPNSEDLDKILSSTNLFDDNEKALIEELVKNR